MKKKINYILIIAVILGIELRFLFLAKRGIANKCKFKKQRFSLSVTEWRNRKIQTMLLKLY